MFDFKVGLYELNDDINFNFQLGRLINWDGGDLEEIRSISRKIKSPDDWKESLIKLGDRALGEERITNAVAYYRMSEFFMYDGDEEKLKYYKLAKELFYDNMSEFFSSGEVERAHVPYENAELPVLLSKVKGDCKGTIVMFGGNDSYLEELFFIMLYMKNSGYNVYLFEGPGQGAVLRESGVKFTHEWEKVVKSVLDYFCLDDVILIGISLGGMLAPRAAAFEKRVSKVVCWSAFPSFIDVLTFDFPPLLKGLYKIALKLRLSWLINIAVRKKMKNEPIADWGIKHGMYAYNASRPYEYLKTIEKFKITDTAHLVTQDVFVMQGKTDHFINWRLYKETVDSFVNAKSITLRLFTEQESASDHCQCGNPKLAIDSILGWLDMV